MSRSSTIRFIFIVFVFAFLIFLHVATVNEIKNMTREKITKTELLNEKLNRIEMNTVEIQKLSSEERIVKIAKDTLGMLSPIENLNTIRVDKYQIEQLEKILQEKYD
ncbi:septum formation initiator family protein [Melioribacter sp. Ez-97]|uniref:septum formation initiator family protein n=1 Tax=Melioribacter sp. Ez-97 TaxID=3423434 RepID=UPI003EDAEF11